MNKLCKFLFFLLPITILSQSSNNAINKYRSDLILQQSIIRGMKNSMGNLNKDFLPKKNTFSIAFGSCSSEDNDLPIFNNVVKHQALFLIYVSISFSTILVLLQKTKI